MSEIFKPLDNSGIEGFSYVGMMDKARLLTM
jgi:hypothetical protein